MKVWIGIKLITIIAILSTTLSYAESPYPNDITIEITPSFRHIDTFKVNGFSTAITDVNDDFIRQPDDGTEFSDPGIGISGRVVTPAICNYVHVQEYFFIDQH